MATFPTHHYRRGKMPSAKRLSHYLAHHEKREASYIVGVDGRRLSADEAMDRLGGPDGIEGRDYWHRLACMSREESDFITEKTGLPPHVAAQEQGRILARDLQRICNLEKPPIVAVHLEKEEDGGLRWHYHILGTGKEPSGLQGARGHLQKTWDREMRVLVDENKKIVDWTAHNEWKALREEHGKLVQEQRELSEKRSAERKGLARLRRNVKDVRFADRASLGLVPGLRLVGDLSQAKANRLRREVEAGSREQQRALVERRHRLEMAMLAKRYQARGAEGSQAHQEENQKVEARRGKAHLGLDRGQGMEEAERLRERSASLRLASRMTFGLVPGLSLAAKVTAIAADRKARKIEVNFNDKEMDLVRRSRDAAMRREDANFKALGTSGCPEHRMKTKEIQRKASGDLFRIQTRGMDRKAISHLRQAQGKAISTAKRAVSRSTGVALESAKSALREIQKKTQVERGNHVADRMVDQHTQASRHAKEAPKRVLSQVVKSSIAVSSEAAKAVAEAAAKLSIRTVEASVKLGGGLILALPTGGASLTAASKEAGQDLAKGTVEAGQATAKGAGATAKRAAGETKDVAMSAVSSITSMGLDALPPAAREALAAGRKSLSVGKDVLTLNFTGAVTGSLVVGRHAAGAVAEGSKSLPSIVKMPLRVVECVPLAGTALKVIRVGMETAHTLSAGAGVAGKAFEMER